MSLNLQSPVSELKGVGAAYAGILGKNGVRTVYDLLLHFPQSYIDTGAECKVILLGRPGLYRIRLGRLKLSRNFARRLSWIRVEGRIGRKAVTLFFFNQPYLSDSLKGREQILVFGRIEKREGLLQMVNPRWIQPGQEGRILPLYAPISGIQPGRLRTIIAKCLERLAEDIDPLPQGILRRHGFPGPVEAFKALHMPDRIPAESGSGPRRRFIYTEFFHYHLELTAVRSFFTGRPRPRTYRFHDGLRRAVAAALPFTLTAGQIRVFEEIVSDLLSPHAMTRLLQGEVGSGKTVLAFLALLMAVQNGYQGAFLAPTEILAGQHFANARAFFRDTPHALLTGSTPPAERKRIIGELQAGVVCIVFGTHALLQEAIRFRGLALVVIDEQHRFGVAQRAALYCKGQVVDLLVTTATPIPRTLQLALYRDMTVSVLKKEIGGQSPVVTRVIPQGRRDGFYRWLRRRLEAGATGYIVLPLIESSESFSDLRSLQEEKPYFQDMFRGIRWATLSGRQEGPEKQRVLQRLRQKELQVLVATTVIEVGIDVPDASFIVIENADRYGLAQLHQMRGRVGRGDEPSGCYLIASPSPTPGGKLRLETMARTSDGFAIAELDLQMRGGGRIAGHEQYGVQEFRLGDPADDLELFSAAEADARDVFRRPEEHTAAIRKILEKVEEKVKSLSFS